MIPDELRSYPQFINWNNQEVPERPGQVTKVPINAATGRKIDAHNPANWLTYDQVAATGQPIAFVITEADPFFCCDLDGCIQEGVVASWALEILNRFPNAFVEISQSGTGLHIWGMSQLDNNHKRSWTHLGHKVELYDKMRFIALGFNGIGNIWLDHTAALTAFVPRRDAFDDIHDGSAPVPEYTGPEDDSKLLDMMLNSQSAKSVFGDGVSFTDLWNADPESLSRAYPDPHRPFDHSRADAALLSHLAFWTGKDGGRMNRLFAMSKLNRDKWQNRPDYRARSISGAIGRCKKVYDVQKTRDNPSGTPPEVPNAAGSYRTLVDQADIFADCVYIRDAHRIFSPRYGLLEQKQFKATYGGYEYQLMSNGRKSTRDAFEAFTVGEYARVAQQVDMPAFRPDKRPGEVYVTTEGSYCNTYVQPEIETMDGDPTPMLDLIRKLLPDPRDQAILICYLAAMIQYLGTKFRWCPVLQGAEGNGKTLVCELMENIIGHRYSWSPQAKKINNQFNGWLYEKLFVHIQEIYIADRRDLADTLKNWVTDRRVEIEGKGKDQLMVDNRVNFIACTNHYDAIQKTVNERRYAVFFTNQQNYDDLMRDGLTDEYFTNLANWIHGDGSKIFAHYLMNISIPDEFNPATKCVRAPFTSMIDDVIEQSRSPLQQMIIDIIESDDQGFRNGWVSTAKLQDTLKEERGRKVAPHTLRTLLQELGYVRHPGLKNGRACRKLFEENARPYLWIQKGLEQDHVGIDANRLTNMYCADQGYMTVESQPN